MSATSIAHPPASNDQQPRGRKTTPQRAVDSRAEQPPAVADEAIKGDIIRARDLIQQGLTSVIEAGRILAKAKEQASQKSAAKSTTYTWADYLADIKLPRQTAEDAIRFAEAFDGTKSEAKRQLALIQPSRAKALEVLGHARKTRNTTAKNDGAVQQQQQRPTEDKVDAAAVLMMLETFTDQIIKGTVVVSKHQGVDLAHAANKLVRIIEQRQQQQETQDHVRAVADHARVATAGEPGEVARGALAL